MIKRDISDHIVTVSIDYHKPRGGIAQVLHLYSTFFETYNFVTTVTGEKVSRFSKAFTGLKGYANLLRYLMDKNIKIVHIHSAQGPSFYRKGIFAITAKAFKKKVVLHMHAGKFKKFAHEHPRVVKSVLKKVDCIVALSDTWKEYFTENYPGKPIYVINNPIETPVFLDKEETCYANNEMKHGNNDNSDKHDKPNAEETLNKAILNVCFLGKICDEKGIFDLLEVLKRHKEKYQGRLRLIVGGVGEVERLKQFITDNHLEELVEYAGWVNGQRKIELFNKAVALLLPSYFEGVPLCILEAMSYGLTVGATEVGGIPEVVRNGENGFLFAPGDLEGIEKVLDLIVNNPSDKPLFQDQAKASVAKHDLKEVEKSLLQLYTKLLEDC